ncbi:hypothetical protein G9A89_009316 [Geosiphon pyriformis]|nr:hypothetical protein G9A89_009316 [Geosiphon pyriformis]
MATDGITNQMAVQIKVARKWQSAVIEYSNQEEATRAVNQWSTMIRKDTVRIYSMVEIQKIIEQKKTWEAKLVDLPQNCTVHYLSTTLDQIKARSYFISRTSKNYTRMGCAYIEFDSEASHNNTTKKPLVIGDTLLIRKNTSHQAEKKIDKTAIPNLQIIDNENNFEHQVMDLYLIQHQKLSSRTSTNKYHLKVAESENIGANHLGFAKSLFQHYSFNFYVNKKISSLLRIPVNTESARETFYRELIQNTNLPTNHNFAFIITEINKKIEHYTQQRYPITYASKGKGKLQTPVVTPKKIQPPTWKKTRVESPTAPSYHYTLGSAINITLASTFTSNTISTFRQFSFQRIRSLPPQLDFGTITLWELSEEESEDQEFTYQNPILENPEFGTANIQTQQENPEIETPNI